MLSYERDVYDMYDTVARVAGNGKGVRNQIVERS